LGCGQHRYLPSVLFVLATFFIAAAVTALAWIEAAALTRLLILLGALAGLLATLLAALVAALTGGAIILWIATRRVLSGLTSALFHSLISFSVVCHIIPPLWFPELNCQAVEVRPRTEFSFSTAMPNAKAAIN